MLVSVPWSPMQELAQEAPWEMLNVLAGMSPSVKSTVGGSWWSGNLLELFS